MPAAQGKKIGQFELSLFMDLSQFEELERRVNALIDQQRKLRVENDELRSKVSDLEDQITLKAQENSQLTAQRDELLSNQRDLQKEELIRCKVTDLLQKLEGL